MSVQAAIKAVIMSTGLTGLGAGWAAEQQASFAVAITLHTISKPMTAAQLCPEGKALDRVNVSIRVSCPDTDGQLAATPENPFPRASGRPSSVPIVVVTF